LNWHVSGGFSPVSISAETISHNEACAEEYGWWGKCG
jgi:hypothetical protein